jgi:hypothetical protein
MYTGPSLAMLRESLYNICMYALFNDNKQFIGFSPDITDQSKILKHKIPKEFSDFRMWKWVGDYDSGRMVSVVEEGYPEEELSSEKQLFEEIHKKYNTQYCSPHQTYIKHT